jgi:hypothetical protein
MAFRCEICKKVQENGTKASKVVITVRNVTYPVIKDASGRIIKTPVGHETAKELTVCPECATKDFEVIVMDEKVLTKKEV